MSKKAPKSQIGAAISAQKAWSLRRKLFWGTLWGLWALLLLAGVLLAYGWTQRYHYLEQAAQQILAEDGIEAELQIISVSGTALRLENVTLRDAAADTIFLSAARIDARYDWREAIKGRVDYVKFTRPQMMVELDASGKMLGGWVPPRQEDRQDGETGTIFPKDGFHIVDGVLNLKTPYGHAAPRFDADVFGPDNFALDLELPPARLSYNHMNAQISGPVSISAREGAYDTDFELDFTDVALAQTRLKSGGVQGTLKIEPTADQWGADQWHVTGPLAVEATEINSGAASLGTLTAALQNDVYVPPRPSLEALKTWGTVSYKGEADLTAINLAVQDQDLKNTLAARISFAALLDKSPVLRDFAPELTRQISQRLSSQDIKATLSFDYDDDGFDLFVPTPISLIKNEQIWRVSAPDNRGEAESPLISLTPQGGGTYNGTAQFNFTKSGRLPLSLRGAQAEFSGAGLAAMPQLSNFTAQLNMASLWEAGGGKTQLLAPQSDIKLLRSADNTQFTARTAFYLSGDVPGGYIKGGEGKGQLDITTQNGGSHMVFTPESRVKFARMDLNSGWILDQGDLKLSKPFEMTGPAQKRIIDIGVNDMTARIHDGGGERDFQLTLAAAQGQGVLSNADTGLSQVWNMDLTDAQLTSENFPLTETDVVSPRANLSVKLMPNAAPIFDINSPMTRISSSLVSAEQIAVAAAGTADNLTLDYDAERFVFSDEALPEIPMAGQTRFIEGRWTGESIARLPEDRDTPIDITFEFEDGTGTADINIAALQFIPGKLQPQNLVSALRGKIGNVKGAVSTSIQLGFGEGQPLRSSGRAMINDLNFGTLPGPVKGLNAELEFTSMFPLETSGRQIVRVASFDPGFPLQDGEIEFELVPGAMKIFRAEWPAVGGRIYFEPLTWSFTANENKVVLVLEDLPIQNLVKREREAESKFDMTGAISGRLPVTVSGVNVTVEGGKLSVPGGGVIKLKSSETDIAGAQNPGVGGAFDALKNFQYESLEADINGPLDGLVRLQAIFSGYNEDVYNKQPFEFDIELEGELFNLIRELNPETQRRRAVSGQLLNGPPP